jgi:hypothetical protein
MSNILHVSANRYQNSAIHRLFIANFHTLKHLTSKLKAHMTNAMLINIQIWIHFTIRYSVTNSFRSLALDRYATENCRCHVRTCCDTLQVTFYKHSLPASCSGGRGSMPLCLFWQRHKIFHLTRYFALHYVSCIIPYSCTEFTINFKTFRLLIGLRARGICQYTFTHILVQYL